MTRRQPFRHHRPGFTLVEILVAAALTVLTMAILATAFQVGVNTLSHLRTIGQLSEQLRNAEAVMRGDLGGPGVRHLENQNGEAVKLSDPGPVSQNLATFPWAGSGKSGYFHVIQYANTFAEGTEEGIASYRSPDCRLFFTTKIPAVSASESFVADITSLKSLPSGPYPATISDPLGRLQRDSLPDTKPGTFASEWAEIGYFLQPSTIAPFTKPDEATTTAQPALQLYSLYRRQRLLFPNVNSNGGPVVLRQGSYAPYGTTTTPPTEPIDLAQAYPELSVSTAPVALTNPANTAGTTRQAVVNTPGSINTKYLAFATAADRTQAVQYNRLAHQYWTYNSSDQAALASTTVQQSLNAQLGQPTYGTDLVLSNVISMQILVMTSANPGQFLPLDDNTVTLTGPLANLRDYTSLSATTSSPPWQIDTAVPSAAPGVTIRALQIKLRIYDTKNRATRQISVTQDL